MGQRDADAEENGATDGHSKDFVADAGHVRLPQFDDERIAVLFVKECAGAHRENPTPIRSCRKDRKIGADALSFRQVHSAKTNIFLFQIFLDAVTRTFPTEA